MEAVFEADAEASRNVDARLVREAHARRQRRPFATHQVHRLVAVQADAVTSAMRQAGEFVTGAIAERTVVTPHRIVDRSGGCSHFRRLQRDLLAACDGVPDLALLRARSAEHEAARHIGLIALDTATAVHQHDFAARDFLRLARAVGIGRCLAEQDQVELDRPTQRTSGGCHQRGDVRVAHPLANARPDPAIGGDRHIGGKLHQRDLGRGLDHAAAAHDRVGRNDPGSRQNTLQAVDGEIAHRLLDPDRPGSELALLEEARDHRQRIFILLPDANFGGNAEAFADRRRGPTAPRKRA
jgi:hypothetical protein